MNDPRERRMQAEPKQQTCVDGIWTQLIYQNLPAQFFDWPKGAAGKMSAKKCL